MFNPPVAGISEPAEITTLVEYRGRGIAAALTGEMVRVAFQHQVNPPILMTENGVAYRVYRRIVFFPAAALVRKAPE
jgi:predicted GNAT family acetyltransferase